MISEKRAFELIQDTVSNMGQEGLLSEEIVIRPDTLLQGKGAAFDSLAFVTLVIDLEVRLNQEINQDVLLKFDDIQAFADDAPLTVAVLMRYIVELKLGDT